MTLEQNNNEQTIEREAVSEAIIPFHVAVGVSEEIIKILSPHCNRIQVAGSVRRKVKYVKDIEVMCEPKYEMVDELVQPDLFDIEFQAVVSKQKRIVDQNFIDIVNGWDKVKGEPTGRYTQRILPISGDYKFRIKLDLFISYGSEYWRQLAIRTGSANYSHHVLARGWKRKGWVGTSDGLRRDHQCRAVNNGSNTWQCMVENPELPPQWDSEEDFFNFIGIRFLPPEYRH